MSANSVALDPDIGLFSNGSISVDSMFDELGLYSEGDIETKKVETAHICEEKDVDMDVYAKASDVEPEGELPREQKNVICKKGKGNVTQNLIFIIHYILLSGKCNHTINSITGKHFQNKAIEVKERRNSRR